MTQTVLLRAAQSATLVVLSAAGSAVVVMAVIAIIGAMALAGVPLVLGVIGAASWPLAGSCLYEARGECSRRALGLPGWTWLAAGGLVLGFAIT